MRLGIVGSGGIVKECLKAIKGLEKIKTVAICVRESSLEIAKELSKDYGIEKIYTNYEEFLSDKEIEFVYIGIINSLHFDYAKQALKYNKNIIGEKPFTSNFEEAQILADTAKEKNLYIFEAITTIYSPNFLYIKEHLKEIGDIKLIQCNYSQYSSRYNKYLEGIVLPAFDLTMSGGALYDINIYNLHFVLALFGRPNSIIYNANLGFNGIDTSGVLVLKYEGFTAVCCGAKDSQSPSFATVQGTKGYLKLNSPPNVAKSVESMINGEIINHNYDSNPYHMINEFAAFEKMYRENELEKCYENLNHSLLVMEILTKARKDAGIVFPTDN